MLVKIALHRLTHGQPQALIHLTSLSSLHHRCAIIHASRHELLWTTALRRRYMTLDDLEHPSPAAPGAANHLHLSTRTVGLRSSLLVHFLTRYAARGKAFASRPAPLIHASNKGILAPNRGAFIRHPRVVVFARSVPLHRPPWRRAVPFPPLLWSIFWPRQAQRRPTAQWLKHRRDALIRCDLVDVYHTKHPERFISTSSIFTSFSQSMSIDWLRAPPS